MTPVEASTLNLAALEEKLVEAKAQLAKVSDEARVLAYDAHTAGGKSADRLKELQGLALAGERNIVSIEIALGEAKRRLADAQAGERSEVEDQRARMALGLLQGFAARGQALDKAFERVMAEYAELSGDFRQLASLGYAPTSYELVSLNMKRAANAKIQFSDMRQEFLAPKDRHTFAEVISAWAQNVRGRATARLNKGSPAKDSKAA
jgi:hypothetical protein